MEALTKVVMSTIVFIIALFLGYMQGRDDGKALIQKEWDKNRGALVKASLDLIEQHEKDMAKTVAIYNQTNLDNTEKHENKLKIVNDALALARAESKRLGGLRIPASTCQTTATNAETAGTSERNAESTATIALPAAIEDGLWAIVGDADRVTEQLRACQGWIRDSGFYGEK